LAWICYEPRMLSNDDPDGGLLAGVLEDLILNSGDPVTRRAAVIALADISKSTVISVLHRMFDRYDGDGSAERLLAYFSGKDGSTMEEIIASLPGIDSVLGVLTLATLGERGAAAVPAVHAALRAFPFPTRTSEHWFRDESTKYWLMRALQRAGAAAAPATPTLLAVLEDDEIYRDTRHQAKATLQAIGLPETADTIAAEIRRRVDRVAQCDDGEMADVTLLLDVLSGMPSGALAASREVGPALEALRRRFGDGRSTYEEDGEIIEYPVYEIRLADLIDDEIAHRGSDSAPDR
jgi:hypothetical protein